MLQNALTINHGFQHIVRQQFDFGDFVRSAKTIEEMQKRNALTERSRLRNKREVVRFLHRAGGEQCDTCLPDRHHVGVIAENG